MRGEIVDKGLFQLTLACVAFVGTHLVLSNPLRRTLARKLGERGFLGLYSLVSIVTLAWTIFAYHRAVRGAPLWDGTAPLPWIAASVLTYVALVLILASLRGNPALPGANVAGLSARRPWGVFRLTRHPMMIGIALWALGHVLAMPTQRMIVLGIGFIVLALLGSHWQDRRKLASQGREWGVWMARTTFVPNLRQAGAIGATWMIGLVAWLAVTAAHLYFGNVPAGIWALVR
jgi:uncharacterized membrane protein